MTSDVELSKVRALLVSVRDAPVNTADATDDILGPIYSYLMKIPPSPSDNTYHWFCSRAQQLTIDAATFLLRLFAYDSPRVDEWKKRLKSSLAGCCHCIKGLGEAKTSSRKTLVAQWASTPSGICVVLTPTLCSYFGAFSDSVLEAFYGSFDDWELSIVVEALVRSGVDLSSSTLASRTSQKVSQPVLYHMVSNMRVFRDPQILSLVRACPSISGWPSDPPPPGLFVLLMDESPDVRQWAKAQVIKSTQVPMLESQFVAGHELALQAVISAVSLSRKGEVVVTDSTSPYFFSSDPTQLWSGFSQILRHVPTEVLAKPSQGMDCKRIVMGHLHDVGPRESYLCSLP